MRCKAGELCVVVCAGKENTGAFLVTVVPDKKGGPADCWAFKDASRPLLDTSGLLSISSGDHLPSHYAVIPDSCLIPVRWPDGEDGEEDAEPLPTTKRLAEAEFDAARAKWGERV